MASASLYAFTNRSKVNAGSPLYNMQAAVTCRQARRIESAFPPMLKAVKRARQNADERAEFRVCRISLCECRDVQACASCDHTQDDVNDSERVANPSPSSQVLLDFERDISITHERLQRCLGWKDTS
jgi:hypothetical protein